MAPKRESQRMVQDMPQYTQTKHRTRPSSSVSSNPFAVLEPTGRVTKTHVYFHQGLLSNWWLKSPDFPGARCFELMVPSLDDQEIPHPSLETLSTRLMSDHMFNCGEQWMMAMKGWIFERDVELSERRVDTNQDESTEDAMGRKEYESLRTELLAETMKDEWKPYVTGRGNLLTREGQMYESTICKVLRSKTPGEQKAHGRHASRFNDYTWKEASIASTVAACIARAELDVHLRRIYNASTDKTFVEGSVSDVIWGVGISFKKPQIENEALWRGENRLGKCHGEAARRIRDMFGENTT